MYKVSRVRLRRSTAFFTTIGILLIVTITGTPTMSSSALDFGILSKDSNLGSIDTKSLFNCFGAAITCDNDNTVNNNVAINNGTNPPPDGNTGTLTVSKQVVCTSQGGSPSNEVVCDYAINSVNFADPEDFEMVVAASAGAPSPGTFEGSSAGTAVTMGPGSYTINEVVFYDDTNLTNELSASFVTTQPTGATGDCSYRNEIANLVDGIMTSGDSQVCTIINTIFITNGTVPGTPEI